MHYWVNIEQWKILSVRITSTPRLYRSSRESIKKINKSHLVEVSNTSKHLIRVRLISPSLNSRKFNLGRRASTACKRKKEEKINNLLITHIRPSTLRRIMWQPKRWLFFHFVYFFFSLFLSLSLLPLFPLPPYGRQPMARLRETCVGKKKGSFSSVRHVFDEWDSFTQSSSYNWTFEVSGLISE